jgi:hypothetical protein
MAQPVKKPAFEERVLETVHFEREKAMTLETYIRYLEEQKANIESGKPIVIQVVDRDIFEAKTVRAVIAKDREALPDGEDLWIKDDKEELAPVPWRIKILEETGEIFARPSRGARIE